MDYFDLLQTVGQAVRASNTQRFVLGVQESAGQPVCVPLPSPNEQYSVPRLIHVLSSPSACIRSPRLVEDPPTKTRPDLGEVV